MGVPTSAASRGTKGKTQRVEMECSRSVVLAKQMLTSKAVAGDSMLRSNFSQGGEGEESTKLSLSPFQWILRTNAISPSSIFYRLESLYSPRSFDSTTAALDPF